MRRVEMKSQRIPIQHIYCAHRCSRRRRCRCVRTRVRVSEMERFSVCYFGTWNERHDADTTNDRRSQHVCCTASVIVGTSNANGVEWRSDGMQCGTGPCVYVFSGDKCKQSFG